MDIVNAENVTDIVIGLPLNADGTEGERVDKVKNFAHMLTNGLANRTGELYEPKSCTGEFHEPNIPIVFQDERLTTAEAKSILQECGIPKTEWKKNIDQIAAEIILQDYRQVKTKERICQKKKKIL